MNRAFDRIGDQAAAFRFLEHALGVFDVRSGRHVKVRVKLERGELR
jgi:hypothetical protein